MVQQKILVLGAASWLGSLLLRKLNQFNTNFVLAGTIHQQNIDVGFVQLVKAEILQDYENLLFDFQPTVIVNFLRGENEAGFGLHNRLIEFVKSTQGFYIFASSALALDGYENIELTEEMLAKGKSPYGVFKARCEQKLYESSAKWCILRFASTQGWVSHKLTRNEIFLKKLSLGEMIEVDTGVIQNRMLADVIIDGIVQIIEKQLEGIIHFGTVDSSEEFDFLKKQAELFGYSSALIRKGEVRNVNLVAIPRQIIEIFGKSFEQTENDTLKGLIKTSGLLQYKNNRNTFA